MVEGRVSKKIYYYLDRVEAAVEGEVVMPVTCEIDLSNRCQLDCSFCMYKDFRKKNSGLLPWTLYVKLIRDLASAGVRSATFTGGGEPLTHPNFSVFVDIAKFSGLEVGLITNGVAAELILEEASKFKFVRVSLDAGTPETYAKIKGRSYFYRVLQNVRKLVYSGVTVGISFVVCEENKHEIPLIEKIGVDLGVKYVQIKPAWINGSVFSGYSAKSSELSLISSRARAKDLLPCAVASLVGVVSATGDVYYCCQHRGNPKYRLGNLADDCFPALWESRPGLSPDISSCPMCRYVEYAESYRELVSEGTMFFKHRNFL